MTPSFSRSGKLLRNCKCCHLWNLGLEKDLVNPLSFFFAVAPEGASDKSDFAYQLLLELDLLDSERLVEETVHHRAFT